MNHVWRCGHAISGFDHWNQQMGKEARSANTSVWFDSFLLSEVPNDGWSRVLATRLVDTWLIMAKKNGRHVYLSIFRKIMRISNIFWFHDSQDCSQDGPFLPMISWRQVGFGRYTGASGDWNWFFRVISGCFFQFPWPWRIPNSWMVYSYNMENPIQIDGSGVASFGSEPARFRKVRVGVTLVP